MDSTPTIYNYLDQDGLWICTHVYKNIKMKQAENLNPQDMTANQKLAKDINRCINAFYIAINACHVEGVHNVVSPNLWQLTLVKKHQDKFQKVLLFGREIVGYKAYQLSEVHPGCLTAFVVVSLKPDEQTEHGHTSKKKKRNNASLSPDELMYRAYKFRFIEIDDVFYIDDIYLYNEFWANEFKDVLLKE